MTPPGDEQGLVRLGSLKRYLTVTGWQKRHLPTGLDLFFNGDGNDVVEIVLPDSRKTPDVDERINRAILTLTSIEDRSRSSVVASILAIGIDIIRASFPTIGVYKDSVNLSSAEDFLHRMSKLIASTAHAELHVGPHYNRIDAVALQLSERYRLGHTFRGSFGFTIEAPVGPNTPQPGDVLEAPPLERRVVLRMARGLRMVERAIQTSDPDSLAASFESGFNANGFDELAALINAPTASEVAFQFSLSREWPVPADVQSECRITIQRERGMDVLDAASKAMRKKIENKSESVVGMIVALRSPENPADLFSQATKDIVIEWNSSEYGRRLVRVSLPSSDYLEALAAHGDGRSVLAEGVLERGARQWRISKLDLFLVL